MSPSRPLQLGSVVWAELEDPNRLVARFASGIVVTPSGGHQCREDGAWWRSRPDSPTLCRTITSC